MAGTVSDADVDGRVRRSVFRRAFVKFQSNGVRGGDRVDDFKIRMAGVIRMIAEVAGNCTKKHPTTIKECEGSII